MAPSSTGVIPAQVLTDSLGKLLPKYENLFAQESPVLGKILKGGNVQTLKSGTPYIEFRIVEEGPGDVTTINTGHEIFPYTMKELGAKGHTFATRELYSWAVPIPEMNMANTPEGIEHLHKQYPEIAFMDFMQRILRQFLVGSGEIPGFCTLQGATTYKPKGVSQDGVFSAKAPSAQSNTVFGLGQPAASTDPHEKWSHEYGHITSMSSTHDGELVLVRAYNRASAKGAPMMGPVDIIVADEVSYHNYIANRMNEIIRQDSIGASKGNPSVGKGIGFHDATIYFEPFLDSDNAYVQANDGMFIGIKTKTWHFWQVPESITRDITKTQGFIRLRGPMRVPNQDKYAWEYIFDGQVFCTYLPANFLVTGGQNV